VVKFVNGGVVCVEKDSTGYHIEWYLKPCCVQGHRTGDGRISTESRSAQRHALKKLADPRPLWYGGSGGKLGMAEASPMNLRVCRKLGRIEFKRLMNAAEALPQRNFEAYRELFELEKRFSCRSSSPFKSITQGTACRFLGSQSASLTMG